MISAEENTTGLYSHTRNPYMPSSCNIASEDCQGKLVVLTACIAMAIRQTPIGLGLSRALGNVLHVHLTGKKKQMNL